MKKDTQYKENLKYCPNLFYSKVNYEEFTKAHINTFKKDFHKLKIAPLKKAIIHSFPMSYYISGNHKENYDNISIFLKINGIEKYKNIINYNKNDISSYASLSKLVEYDLKIIKKKYKENVMQGGFIFDIFHKTRNNHKLLCGNKLPEININEMTFLAILSNLSLLPPSIFRSQKIINVIDITFKNYILDKYTYIDRKTYLKNNFKIKKIVLKNITEIINKKCKTIEEKLNMTEYKITTNTKYIKNILYLFDKKTETSPYIYIIDRKLFVIIKGSITYNNLKQDLQSLYYTNISKIIKIYLDKNEVLDSYKKILEKIKNEYGKYTYARGFFLATLHIFYEIFEYIIESSKNYDEIYINGHSLGAVKANIITMFLIHLRKLSKYKKIKNKTIKLVTFGEPSGIFDNKNGRELVKKINSHIGKTFKYVRVLGYMENKNGTITNDIITSLINPRQMLFIGHQIPLNKISESECHKVISPDTGKMLYK